MKNIIATLLIITLTLLSLTACFSTQAPVNNGKNDANVDNTKLRIGYMSGPTGMGMAKLIHDNGGIDGNDKYSFFSYTDSALAKADLTKGAIDVICIPTNEALAYYHAVDNNTRILAVNCLNSLYLISDSEHNATSLADLEGETIYTCKNGTPRIILNYIINALDLDIKVSYSINDTDMNTPAEVNAQVIAGNLPYAVIPEPIITAATSANTDYSVDINLADEWAKIPALKDTPVTMGCIVASQEFINAHPTVIDNFLVEYKDSVSYIGNIENLENSSKFVAEAKIMAAAPAAKKALANLGTAISYIDGKEMKAALTAFYNAIEMVLPGDEFYYEK